MCTYVYNRLVRLRVLCLRASIKCFVNGAGFEPALQTYNRGSSARCITASTLTTHHLSFEANFFGLSRIKLPPPRRGTYGASSYNHDSSKFAHGYSALSSHSLPPSQSFTRHSSKLDLQFLRVICLL